MADEKNTGSRATTAPESRKTVSEKYADATLQLLEDHGDKFGPLTPEAETKLRRKLYLRVMLLLSAINVMLFVRPRILLCQSLYKEERR